MKLPKHISKIKRQHVTPDIRNIDTGQWWVASWVNGMSPVFLSASWQALMVVSSLPGSLEQGHPALGRGRRGSEVGEGSDCGHSAGTRQSQAAAGATCPAPLRLLVLAFSLLTWDLAPRLFSLALPRASVSHWTIFLWYHFCFNKSLTCLYLLCLSSTLELHLSCQSPGFCGVWGPEFLPLKSHSMEVHICQVEGCIACVTLCHQSLWRKSVLFKVWSTDQCPPLTTCYLSKMRSTGKSRVSISEC